jgi:uncharacterized protein (DUF2252 family)
MTLEHDASLPDPLEARTRGRAQREHVPRTSLADVADRTEHTDPVVILGADAVDRISELVPIRYERMLESPLAFFRGAASVMAADLARGPSSAIEVQICGDAHLSNFGVFSSPERRLVFDVNDFDETARGPFEWDVKRLVTSLVIAGTQLGLSARDAEHAAFVAARKYRTSIREFAEQTVLGIWYSALALDQLIADLEEYFSDNAMAQVNSVVSRARGKTAVRAFEKLVDVVNGRPRIAYDPPLLVPLDRLYQEEQRASLSELLTHIVADYSDSLAPEMRGLLAQFTPIDGARKVVGVGSVGTRCYVVLFLGRDTNDPFFLQIKEATVSAIDRARGVSSDYAAGERVVRGQRLMQATPDIFLGWHNMIEADGVERSYYVRQLFDNKASVVVERLSAVTLAAYGEVCAWTLARAHARSGAASEIAGYLGKSEKFDNAITSFALAYQERNEADFDALKSAAAQGRLPLTT